MTTYDNELISATGDAQAVIDAATRAAGAMPVDPERGRFVAFSVPAGGDVEVVDLDALADKHRDTPKRKAGAYAVHDALSFIAYLGKHGTDATEVWADAAGCRIVGVLDAHGSQDAGWGGHRVTFAVQHTEAWRAWTALDGKLIEQAALAEHLENRAVDIVRPSAATMLEVAETFQATIGVNFESSKLLSSGERQFLYRETVDSKAGRAGQLEIPKDFDLALTPFEGASMYKVKARFRYRITDGALRVGYKLERPTDVIREAFSDVVTIIEGAVEAPVLRGVSA